MGRFSEFKPELRGPWDAGWYSGVVVAEYERNSKDGGMFVEKTSDMVSNSTDSRNLKLCVRLVNGSMTKDITHRINYRPEALTDERMKEVLEARTKFKGTRGAWADKLAQRDNLALSGFHELERAGIPLEENGHGGFDVDKMIGQAADFRLSVTRRKFPNEQGNYKTEAVPKDVIKSATDEERATWENKISGVAAVSSKVK
jgi:hypothetical protein